MSKFIADYRTKYPEYNDIEDSKLIQGLTGKYNAENNATMTVEAFGQAIGYQPQVTPIIPIEQEAIAPQVQQQQVVTKTPALSIDQQPVIQAQKIVPEQSMGSLVLEKMQQIGEGVSAGFGGAIPQLKKQIGGLLRRDNEFPTREEYEAEYAGNTWREFNYDEDKRLYEALNPVDVMVGAYGKELAQEGRDETTLSKFKRGEPGYYSEALTGSVMNMVPSLAISILGRRPDIGLGVMMAQVKGGSYEQGMSEGLTQQESEMYSSLQTMAEIIPSAFPLAKFMQPSGKFLKDLAIAGVTEGAQEAVTAALNAGIDKGYIRPDMTLQDAFDQIVDGAIIGLGSGVTISAATSKLAEGMNKRDQNKLVADALESEFDKTIKAGPSLDEQAVSALSPERAQIGAVQAERETVAMPKVGPKADSGQQYGAIPESEIKDARIDVIPAMEPERDKTEDEEPKTKEQVTGKRVVEAPIADITISEDVPQFKDGADIKGVVEPLGGKFERTGVAPIQIWVREDGRKEVISGRHRLDLAKRSGETTIPAQYHYETDGFEADQAAALDAVLNIREGQGKVKDYVDFIQATKITEEEANTQGILARQTGKRAYSIASKGSDALIASHRNDQLSDSAATRIAEAAPSSEPLQAVGIKAIQEGKTITVAENLVKAVKSMTGDTVQESGDLFGFDDSAMIEAEALARKASQKQAEIQRTLSAVQGAAKRPELAKKEGVDVKDPKAVLARIDELKEQKREWTNWHTNPALVAELKGEEAPAFNLSTQTEKELSDKAGRDIEGGETKAQIDREAGLFTLDGGVSLTTQADPAQNPQEADLFGQASEPVAETLPAVVKNNYELSPSQKSQKEQGGTGLAGELNDATINSLLLMQNNPNVPEVKVKKRYPNGNVSFETNDVSWIDVGDGVSVRGFTRNGSTIQEIKYPSGFKVTRTLDDKGKLSGSAEGQWDQLFSDSGGSGFKEVEKFDALFQRKAQSNNSTAEISNTDKDTFTFADKTFKKGEYAKAIKSDSRGEFFKGGDIESISHAKTQVKINGTWHDFGSIAKAERPLEYKPEKKPLSKVIESSNDKDLTDADKVPSTRQSYGNDVIGTHAELTKNIAEGFVTAQSLLNNAKSLIEFKDQVIAQLSERKVTKAMLQGMTGGYRNDMTKPQMVKMAYQSMLSSHVMAESIVTEFGGSKSYQDQVMDIITNQTQADVDAGFEAKRQARVAQDRRVEDFKKAMEKPETLPEFKEFIRVRGKDKMTPAQLAAYDELVSESLVPEDRPQIVTGESLDVKTERGKTTHTTKGHDIYVVKMVDRVNRDKFKELNAKAKQFGGYYSTYSKGEAIPGFQFKTDEAATDFENVLKGMDVDKSDFAEAKGDIKQAKNADSLTAMADKLEEKANDELGVDRQTNTGRRASMAANATDKAYKKLALAKTVRKIANKMQDGELKHLSKLSQVTQLEELMSLQNRAITSDMKTSEYDGYSMNYQLKKGVTIDDYIVNVKMPKLFMFGQNLTAMIGKLENKAGFKQLSKELARAPKIAGKDHLREISIEQYDKLLIAVKKGYISDHDLGFMKDDKASMGRLDRLGITTEEQLRAAIRELDSLRVEQQQESPIKKLERDLVGKKIDGYFPTPNDLVGQMMDYADIQAGHDVLEPSAGKGNIADMIKSSVPTARLDVIEFNSGLSALLEAKGYDPVARNFMDYTGKKYDRIVMNPPFENFQDIDHVKHAYELLKPGGKLVAIMGAGVKNSRKKAVEFREWLDDMGTYIEDLPEGSFKTSERPTGVATVMVTIEKNDLNTLNSKEGGKKPTKAGDGKEVYHAPGHNYMGMFRSMGIPERREIVMIDGQSVKMPKAPQRMEPIIGKLVDIIGRRIYNGKIKGKSVNGFYRPATGEIRTRRKNDVEVLAHEAAHYLDVYSNVTLPNFRLMYLDQVYLEEVKELSYTDESAKLQSIEGFAEYVRLWLTNSEEARIRAPKFNRAFNRMLMRDKKLAKKMVDLREMMHKFYFQGPDKLGQALIGQNKSLPLRLDEWKYRRDSRIRQQLIDSTHAARKIEQELTRKVGTVQESAWKQFRLSNGGAEGIADYILNYGTVNFDDTGDIQKTGIGLHEILEPVKRVKVLPEDKGTTSLDLLLRYFAGRRALELHSQGRENLIPKETALEWARLGVKYREFESIRVEYQKFNTRMMDFYQDAGLLTPQSRKTMESLNKDYVPFNRVRDQLAGGAGAGNGAGFQRLKGGTANLNDILVNIQDGVIANTKAALNNKAKQRLYGYISNHKDGAIFATHISPDSKLVKVHVDDMATKILDALANNGIEIDGDLDLTDPGLVEFWQHGVKPKLTESGNMIDSVIINGKPKYYEVQDPLLQDMLLAMNPESYGMFMSAMFGVKNTFTRMIVLGVEFMGANLVRDTVGAAFLSKNNFVPLLDSFRGMYHYIRKDELYQEFMRSGGGYSGRLHGMANEGNARRRISLDEFGVMTVPQKLLSGIDNVASAFEYGTRLGDFRLAKLAGKSSSDAAFEGREISTDFSAIGANHFVTGYIRTIPFLNAMIQSQDRIFRESMILKKYGGNPAGLAMKAFLGITVPTLALYLLNKDDEDYQAIPEYERRTNWHFKIGDNQYIKMPRPYDVGFVYATMPEIFFKYLEDDKGKEFADGMIWTITQMYGIEGVPAMMTGWWDLVRNKKWTGAPVVPDALADVDAAQQYTANTSETFVRLGEATGLSPIKAEHVFKAYTGYLGGYVNALTDHMLWDNEKFGDKPDSQMDDNVFLRRFIATDQRPNTAYMEKFFNLKEKSDRVVATYKKTVDIRRAIKKDLGGKFKDDTFFGLSAEEKKVLFTLNDSMNEIISMIYGKEGIKTAELATRYNKDLTGAEKRIKIDKLWHSRNKVFMQYYNAANRALIKAKAQVEEE